MLHIQVVSWETPDLAFNQLITPFHLSLSLSAVTADYLRNRLKTQRLTIFSVFLVSLTMIYDSYIRCWKKTGYCTIRNFYVHVCKWNPRLAKVLLVFIWQLQNRFQLISWKLPQIFGAVKKIVAWTTNSSIPSSFQRILTYIGPVSTLWAWLSCFCLKPAPIRLLSFLKLQKSKTKQKNPSPGFVFGFVCFCFWFFSQKWLMHSDLVTLLSFHSIGTFFFCCCSEVISEAARWFASSKTSVSYICVSFQKWFFFFSTFCA